MEGDMLLISLGIPIVNFFCLQIYVADKISEVFPLLVVRCLLRELQATSINVEQV